MSLGISSSAWYRLAEHPEVVEAVDNGTAVFARRMATVVAPAAVTLGSWRAAAFWMERRLPDLFGLKLDVHVERSPEQELDEQFTPEASTSEWKGCSKSGSAVGPPGRRHRHDRQRWARLSG